MSYSVLLIILTSIYEYYKFRESLLVIIIPLLLWFLAPSFYYRIILLFIFCIVKVFQIVFSKNILKYLLLNFYVISIVILFYEHYEIFLTLY